MTSRLLVSACTLALLLGAANERAVSARPRAHATADSVVEFHLRDQFGRMHDAGDYRGRVLLLVGAASGGRTSATAWVETLRRMQANDLGAVTLPVVAVADLRRVPRLLRRLVRGRFPDDRDQSVLLDWDGSLARRLAFDAGQCTILIVGPAGHALARTTTNEATVDTVIARAILREAMTSAPADLGPTARSGGRGD